MNYNFGIGSPVMREPSEVLPMVGVVIAVFDSEISNSICWVYYNRCNKL